jgi:hypothetical protein
MEGGIWGDRDKDVNIKIMVTWVFEKRSVKVWTGASWLKTVSEVELMGALK